MSTRPTLYHLLAIGALVLVFAACADSESGGTAAPSTRGDQPAGPTATAGQGGAQDFGHFKTILESGAIPHPDTLDPVGFFNEHAINDPNPECADNLCIDGALAVRGNMLTGSNCTLVMVSFSTDQVLDAEDRPPLNLAIAVDTSGTMNGPRIEQVRDALKVMRLSLRPDDRISLISYDDKARLLIDGTNGDDPQLATWFDTLRAEGNTNLYDGLRQAFEAVDRHSEEGRLNRVLLISGSRPTVGISSGDRIRSMVEAFSGKGTSLSTVGFGLDYDPDLLTRLSEAGAGNYYSFTDATDLHEVFIEEIDAFLLPIAFDVGVGFESSGSYHVRAVHGTRQAELVDLRTASIHIPSMTVAHRPSTDAPSRGRRGGGGAILIELAPLEGKDAEVGTLHLSYTHPETGEVHEQMVEVQSTLDPGETPEAGLFSSFAVEKAFVALNIYVGFRMAADRAAAGDNNAALGILNALEAGVKLWTNANDDSDIKDDHRLIGLFINNLRARGADAPPPTWGVPEPWLVD